MDNAYLGKLDYSDPLYETLISQVRPPVNDPVFHVSMMSRSMVYKYTEEKSGTAIIGKFFKLDDEKEDRISRIKSEYDNLRLIRGYGFDTYPNYVVRPFGREERIGLAVIEEFISGKDLDHYLKRAIYKGDMESLKKRISMLATFLYALHTRTRSQYFVGIDSVCLYFQKIINKLVKHNIVSESDKKDYLRLMDKWFNIPSFQNAQGVLVHGDATCTNFLFTETGDVVAIDLERMKNTDPVFDVGMICGEIKHAFLWRTGNPYESEPVIRHFLESYAEHSHDFQKTFREITFRNPFYMAMTELRIARNSYLDRDYRKRLSYEALECLKWGLRLR